MPDPASEAERDEPEDAGENQVQQGGKHTALHELAEPGDEETANGGKDIASGTLWVVHAVRIL